MATRKAPRTRTVLAAAGLPALFLLGAAIAAPSTSISDPCPQSTEHSVTDLHDMLTDDKIVTPVADTASKAAEESNKEPVVEVEDVPASQASPEYTTRLPGVSASDMPRFRRHMFRTDI